MVIRIGVAGALVLACAGMLRMLMAASDPAADGWPVYGHDPGGMRFSPVNQITRENVSQLKVAWIAHTGDVWDTKLPGWQDRKRTAFENTPILADGTLYVTTPVNRVVALAGR